MSNFDHQSLMVEARARIPLSDGVADDAPPPQGYRPDLPRPPRNAQATSNYKCAFKLLEYIESKLHQDTNDLQEEPTTSTPDILENIALVKHQLDNLLGEINQLHQSAEDSSDANPLCLGHFPRARTRLTPTKQETDRRSEVNHQTT